MTTLRRRIFGGKTSESTPADSFDASAATAHGAPQGGEHYKVVSTEKLENLQAIEAGHKVGTRRNAWIFGLGGLFGVLLAGHFATNNGGLEKFVDLAGLRDLSLDGFIDLLPAGLIKDVQNLQAREKDTVKYAPFAVGLHAHSQGLEAKYPVIMIPGVISTGLESWGTDEQSRLYFRKRLWGSWNMMKALILDKAGWKKHIMLDEITGLDPPGVKVRAAQGFDAADQFVSGWWIWGKILENLATIGYDPTNAFTAAYDWRLSYMNLEIRDQYFTRLKSHIEVAHRISGLKVVLLSHSMGSQVLFYFLHWVEAGGYGNGGPRWVNDHIASWINISGCMLGALKDLPAILSGEMRDTAQLNALAVYGLEQFLSRQERADIFRHMPGMSSMLPMGGEAVWGDHASAPDDQTGQNYTYGNFLNFRQTNRTDSSSDNLTVSESLPYLYRHTPQWYRDSTQQSYSQGIAHSRKVVEDNQRIPAKWVNPLETRLPLAPDMKIFCFYGIGKPTERAYFYKDEFDPTTGNSTLFIDTTVTNEYVDRGVIMGEGDGTVNILSTGYMCNKGWKIKRYNPARIPITTFEMRHDPDRFNPRGGANTADHVDILGRSSLNELILKIAGGQGHLIEDNVESHILEYSEKVKIYEDDDNKEGARTSSCWKKCSRQPTIAKTDE